MSHRYFFQPRMIAGLILLGASSQSFAAPSLNTFMQRVWQENPAIQASESALEAARSRKIAADKPIYNPEIGADLEKATADTFSIGINQTVDWGNKRNASTGIADAEIQLAQAELSSQRLSISAEILNALTNLQAIRAMQNLAQQRVDLMQELLKNTEKRQQAGDVGLQDAALARVALSEAKIQFANAAATQAKYVTQLQVATALFVKQWPSLQQAPPSLAALSNVEKYLQQLPAIRALKAELIAAKSNVNLSKAQRKADPSFGVRGGTEDGQALVGVSFSIPLMLRNSYRAEVEVANQEALQIEHMMRYAILRAEAHLKGSHQRYQLTYDAWQSWQANGLNSLKEQMDLIKTIWKSGEMSTSDYLIQAKQNVDAQQTAVRLSAQMWEAWIEWLVASGQIEQWIKQSK